MDMTYATGETVKWSDMWRYSGGVMYIPEDQAKELYKSVIDGFGEDIKNVQKASEEELREFLKELE